MMNKKFSKRKNILIEKSNCMLTERSKDLASLTAQKTNRRSIRSLTGTKRQSPRMKKELRTSRLLNSPTVLDSRRGSDGASKTFRRKTKFKANFQKNFKKNHLKLESLKIKGMLDFKQRKGSRYGVDVRKSTSSKPTKSQTFRKKTNFHSFRFHSPVADKSSHRMNLRLSKRSKKILHSSTYTNVAENTETKNPKESLIKMILESKGKNIDFRMTTQLKNLLEENEDLKKKLEENYQATNSLIESMGQMKASNAKRCLNSQETCQKMREKMIELENTILETQFDKKSMMEERDILKNENEELKRRILILEEERSEGKVIGPELEEIEEKISEITEQHDEERNFLYIEIVRGFLIFFRKS